jgi:hypothetical protein
MASSPPSDESDPWVILRTVLRVHTWDRDLFFELVDPPRLSFLTVSTRVSPARPPPLARRGTSSVIRHPRILSADLSASLFLTVTPTPHPPAAAPTTASSSSARTSAATDICCFVLDAASCTSHRIPDPAPGFARFGVIAAPDGASFMVVGLRCPIGNDRASLHCFSSRTGGWVTKDVNNPRPHRTWTFSDVIAHDGKLWWVDTTATTTKGLLYCDPFADQPSMSFVPFPNHVTAMEARAKATAYDYVQVADGRLRWVHVLCDLDETEDGAPILNGAPLLSIYVVLGGDDDGYRLDFELLPHWRGDFSFCFIWESDTFKATEMPKYEQPVLALIDPNDTDLLYFFLGDYLFGFDIWKHVVLGYAPHGMDDPDVSSPSSLLAWKLPPALAAPAARRYCIDLFYNPPSSISFRLRSDQSISSLLQFPFYFCLCSAVPVL